MSFGTFADLKGEILARLNRLQDTDAQERVESWISLGEDEILLGLQRLKVRQGEIVNSSFAISSEFTNLPSDFLSLRSGVVLNTTPLTSLVSSSPAQIEQYIAYNPSGRPKYFCIQGNQLRVAPASDASYTAKITYYALPRLTITNTTNWLLQAYPKIYFTAALAEAYDYYENAEQANRFTLNTQRLLDAIYTASGADQLHVNARITPDNGTP